MNKLLSSLLIFFSFCYSPFTYASPENKGEIPFEVAPSFNIQTVNEKSFEKLSTPIKGKTFAEKAWFAQDILINLMFIFTVGEHTLEESKIEPIAFLVLGVSTLNLIKGFQEYTGWNDNQKMSLKSQKMWLLSQTIISSAWLVKMGYEMYKEWFSYLEVIIFSLPPINLLWKTLKEYQKLKAKI